MKYRVIFLVAIAMAVRDKSAAVADVDWPYWGYRMTVFSNVEESVIETDRFKGTLPFHPGAASGLAQRASSTVPEASR